jgi:hypothetical protein
LSLLNRKRGSPLLHRAHAVIARSIALQNWDWHLQDWFLCPIYGWRSLGHGEAQIMVTSITRFQLPPGVPTEAVKKGFLEVAPHFKQPSGLLRKYFLISEDRKTGGGVYLWNSMEQARTFSEGVLRQMIRDKFHLEPSIEYFDSPVVVDNLSSEIIADAAQPK